MASEEPLRSTKRIIAKSFLSFMYLSVVGEGLLSISNGLCKMVPPLILQMQLLTGKFGDRVIFRKTDNPWTAHSQDLSPCDFFLWG